MLRCAETREDGDADLGVRQYMGDSESTALGDMPEVVRMRWKGSDAKAQRGSGGKRSEARPSDANPRPESAPVGYAGVRGGQCVGDGGIDPCVHRYMHPSMVQSDMAFQTSHPGMATHMPAPPQ